MRRCIARVALYFLVFSLLSGCSGKQTQKVDVKAPHYEAGLCHT